MATKNVILLVAHEGYQPIEYSVPAEMLASAGVNVITASDQPGVAVAKDMSTTTVKLTIDKINPTLIDGLFIIGGPGALECLDNSIVHSLLQQMKILKKPYGAICISSRILAVAGVLTGKKATGWNEDNKLAGIFKKHNVEYVNESMVMDGNVVTAVGPTAAQEFAQGILKALGILV